MQKSARILFLLILLLMPVLLTGTLTGCRTAHRDPLCYQKYPFTADGTLTLGELRGEVRFTMEAAGRGSLTFLSPASVAGLRLTVDGEGVCVTLGNHSYAFGEDSGICPVLTRLVAAFSLTERGPLVYDADGFSCNGVRYVCDTGSGYPLSVSGEGFSFTISLFTPDAQQNMG